MTQCRYRIGLLLPLKFKCVLLFILMTGFSTIFPIIPCECTLQPIVVDEGSKTDNILTNLGLKTAVVTKIGDQPNADGKPEEKIVFFGEDDNGTPIVLGSWLQYTSFTLATAIFGTGFLVACAATAVYYVLFVVTEPSQLLRKRSLQDSENVISSSENQWNYIKILKLLGLAYDTYEKLNFDDKECQKKILCELQAGRDKAGEIARQVSNLLINVDVFNHKIPNIKEYREAIQVGQNLQSTCDSKFPSCRFSVQEFNAKIKTL